MSTTIAALIAALFTTGFISAVTHDITHVGSSVVTVLLTAAVAVRRNANIYPLFLAGALAMVILALVSSESNTSAFSSTIHVLSVYIALIGLAFSSPDLSKFCQQLILATNLSLTFWILYQGYGTNSLKAWQITTPFGAPNVMPAELNMTLPFVLARIHQSAGMKRLAYQGLVVLNCLAVFLVMSRNGIATLLIILTLYTLFNYKRLAVIVIGAVAGGASSFDSIAQIPLVRMILTKLRFTGYRASTPRSLIWQLAWERIKVDPILGVGPGGPKKSLAIIETYHAHNNFVQVALETGIPSAAIFTVMFILLLWLPGKTLFQRRDHFVSTLPILAYFSYSWTAMPLCFPGVTLLLVACVHEARVVMQNKCPQEIVAPAHRLLRSNASLRAARAA